MLDSRCLLLLLITASLAPPPSTAGELLFEVESIPSTGRAVAAELAELNGDGRMDLLVVGLQGLPPEEQRNIRVYLRRDDASLPQQPNYVIPLPKWSAVYDIADLKDSPGEEMVLLRPDRVTLLSLADESGRSWDLPVPGPTTIATGDDERGFEPFQLVYDEFGPEPWIIVPQMGQVTALAASGEIMASLDVGRRANFFVIPSASLLSVESNIQVFVDMPKLSIGDVDGDGRVDLVFATRHELRVFLRREDGSFGFEPDRRIVPGLVTPTDHIRGSGGVVSEIRDIDGDGKLDLLISHIRGSFTDAKTTTRVYLNTEGTWNLERPVSEMTSDASIGSNVLSDLDLDGHLELLRIELDFSLLEMVELLLTQEVDIEVSIHRFDPKQGFEPEHWLKRKVSIPFSFDTFRPKGFLPSMGVDLNGDGQLDFMASGKGDGVEVFLGGGKSPYQKRSGYQKMSTAGVIHFADFDNDGLPDFVLFDPHHFDVPVSVARNRGQLPGTAPALRPQD